MAGLAILKHTYDLSDEVLCERWLETPIGVLTLCAPLVFAYLTWFVVVCRCRDCGRRRASALRLSTRCSCGRDHLSMPKLWTRQPFEVQLSGPNQMDIKAQAKPA